MKKVLILGASGYIGSRLSVFFSQNEYLVTAVVNKNFNFLKRKSWADKMNNVIAGDITDESTLALIYKSSYDTIINLISLNHHASDNINPKKVSSINFLPNWILLEKYSKRDLNNFIYFSTTQVYGELTSGLITEESSLNPSNIYGLTHYLSEEVCNYFNNKSDVNCIIFRLSNSFGDPVFNDNKCWSLAINSFCKNAVLKGQIQLESDGKSIKDFIHYTDICGSIDYILKIDLKDLKNLTFNLSTGHSMTIYDAARLVKEVFKEKFNEIIPIEFSKHNQSPIKNEFSKLIIDNSKLKNIGFTFKTNYKKQIYDLIIHLKKYYRN